MIGYKLRRPDVSGTWMYCGTEINEILNCLKVELEEDFEPGNEKCCITLEPFEISQEEIDNMPEFPGW